MKTRGLIRFTLVALAVLLPSFAPAAQQPRDIPPNDNFINAIPLKIGKSYSMPDVGAATNQIAEPTTSCRFDTIIPNSIWYTFSVDQLSFVWLSTFGSTLILPNAESSDTVLAIYAQSGGGTLTHVGCNDDAEGLTAAKTVFSAAPGFDYYVAIGSYDDEDYLPSSTLKLSTKLLWTQIEVMNPRFETELGDSDWKLKNGDDDDRVCVDTTYPAAEGLCAFRFIGMPGRTTKLMQTIPFPSSFVPRKNATLEVGFSVRVVDTGILEKSKVTIKINYKDGTAPTTRTVNLAGTPATSDYFVMRQLLTLASGKVASVKLVTKFGAADGVLLLDVVYISYFADSATRGPLPPPAAN